MAMITYSQAVAGSGWWLKFYIRINDHAGQSSETPFILHTSAPMPQGQTVAMWKTTLQSSIMKYTLTEMINKQYVGLLKLNCR